VSFDIDANGIMHVTAKDLGTGKEQKMTVTGGSSLPKDDIARMVHEAEEHAEEDRRRKEAAETRNQGEQLVHQTEKLIRDNREKIPADVTGEVETALGDLKEKLKGEDPGAIRAAVDRASAAAQKIGTAMYAAQGGRGGGTAGAGGTGGTGGGPASDDGAEEVVDAEIVDDDARDDTTRPTGG
ncbi:Hsp70 family protein, partial [Streptomyces sp. NPDC089799]|uniref:Hsp70 family protein n=1 Tax=Streptomyces sp. NPDC089799 TaxID=3155066 RepID=UPI0034225AD7